jgi:hypothetical protein
MSMYPTFTMGPLALISHFLLHVVFFPSYPCCAAQDFPWERHGIWQLHFFPS